MKSPKDRDLDVNHNPHGRPELQMATVRSQVALSLFTDFENFSSFKPGEQHDDGLVSLFDQVEAWANALSPLHNVVPLVAS